MSKEIPILLSSDNNYLPYLAVTIESIKANNRARAKYKIYILEEKINENNKKNIFLMQNDYTEIYFININDYIKNIDTSIFTTINHFTKAAYFRFFIPDILKQYDKAIYIDCDLIVNHDLKDLFDIDMNSYCIGAIIDFWLQFSIYNDDNKKQYLTKILGMKRPEKYFNSGVMLLDLKKLRSTNFTQKCIERLEKIKNPRYVDQCIINSIFDGDFFFFVLKWNVQCNVIYDIENFENKIPLQLAKQFLASKDNAYIIHYCSGNKPWNKVGKEHYELWWQYARKTTFYEQILFNNIK